MYNFYKQEEEKDSTISDGISRRDCFKHVPSNIFYVIRSLQAMKNMWEIKDNAVQVWK